MVRFQNEDFTLSLSFNLPHPISTTTKTAKSLKTSIEGEVFFNLNLNSGMEGNTKGILSYKQWQKTIKGSTFQVMLYQQGLSELLF